MFEFFQNKLLFISCWFSDSRLEVSSINFRSVSDAAPAPSSLAPAAGRNDEPVPVQLYVQVLQENVALKEKLQEMELQLSQSKVELERLRQVCVLAKYLVISRWRPDLTRSSPSSNGALLEQKSYWTPNKLKRSINHKELTLRKLLTVIAAL